MHKHTCTHAHMHTRMITQTITIVYRVSSALHACTRAHVNKVMYTPYLVMDAPRCTLDRLAKPSNIDWQSTDEP